MRRGHFAFLTCPSCGHERTFMLENLPAEWLGNPPWSIRAEILERMRCKACGRRVLRDGIKGDSDFRFSD